MAKALNRFKGRLVHIRNTWGDNAGQVETETLYQVQQCGPKMATIMRIDPITLQPIGRRRRGTRLWLNTEEEVQALQRGIERDARGYRRFLFSEWDQMFITVGEAGWDPDSNF